MRLSPETTHVNDLLVVDGHMERVIAYGIYTDVDVPAPIYSVVTLMPKVYQKERGNYHTFFMDDEDGSIEGSQFHRNIVEAVRRYEEEMGMDI